MRKTRCINSFRLLASRMFCLVVDLCFGFKGEGKSENTGVSVYIYIYTYIPAVFGKSI